MKRRELIIPQQFNKSNDHVVKGDKDSASKQPNKHKAGQFLDPFRLKKFGLLFQWSKHDDQIYHNGKNGHGYHKPVEFTTHASNDVDCID